MCVLCGKRKVTRLWEYVISERMLHHLKEGDEVHLNIVRDILAPDDVASSLVQAERGGRVLNQDTLLVLLPLQRSLHHPLKFVLA